MRGLGVLGLSLALLLLSGCHWLLPFAEPDQAPAGDALQPDQGQDASSPQDSSSPVEDSSSAPDFPISDTNVPAKDGGPRQDAFNFSDSTVDASSLFSTCQDKIDCKEGMVCQSSPYWPNDLFTCSLPCTEQQDCESPGSVCDNGYCSLSCDPLKPYECLPGTQCTFFTAGGADKTYGTNCLVITGMGDVGDKCQTNLDCLGGLICFSSSGCQLLCDRNAPACPQGTICSLLDPEITIGSITYGYCN